MIEELFRKYKFFKQKISNKMKMKSRLEHLVSFYDGFCGLWRVLRLVLSLGERRSVITTGSLTDW